MPDVRSHSLACLSKSGFHRVAYREFAPQGTVPEHPVPVVCIHGLARNARDFDALAATLAAAGRRVVAVDVVGRGDSEWLRDPLDYVYPQYVSAMATLIARRGCAQVDLVGTSMGGDRKSVVWGKRVSVRVALGGRRIITKKTTATKTKS